MDAAFTAFAAKAAVEDRLMKMATRMATTRDAAKKKLEEEAKALMKNGETEKAAKCFADALNVKLEATQEELQLVVEYTKVHNDALVAMPFMMAMTQRRSVPVAETVDTAEN
jgi:hypothetical protein